MREYETVFITQPNLSDSDQSKLNKRLQTIIERHEGRLFFSRTMGKKNLAFPIKRQTKGVYTCLDYAAKGAAISELERGLKLDENVLRFLTIVKQGDVDVEARAAEVVAKGEDVVEVAEAAVGLDAGPLGVKEDSIEEEE